MIRPSITIEIGASKNLVTITEGEKVTTFDRSKMSLDERIKLTRMLVPAWAKARGIEMPTYRGRRKNGRNKAA